MTLHAPTEADYLLERPLPHNPDTERAILGGILLDPRLMDEILTRGVRPEWFYVPTNRRIFSAMVELHSRNADIDPVTIGEVLGRDRILESCGGISFISNLTYGVPHFSNLRDYTAILSEKFTARWAIKECNKTIAELLDGDEAANTIIAQAADRFSEVREQQIGTAAQGEIGEMVRPVEDHLYLLKAGANPAIETGIGALDSLTGGGISPGEMWGIGALSSHGKTAFLLQVLSHIAKTGTPTILFSIEMMAIKLAIRVLASATGIPFNRIKHSSRESEIDYLISQVAKTFNFPLYIYSDCRSLADIKARLRTVKRRTKVGAIGIDYYGIMSGYGAGRDRYENKTQELKYLATGIQRLAIEEEIGAIVPAQFNRSAWSAPKSAGPGNIDGGEAYFQACDLYATLHTDKPKTETDQKVPAFLEIYKQRNGSTGSVRMWFHRQRMTFEGRIEDEGETVEEPVPDPQSEEGYL